jgi:hypothetical protein
MDTNRSDLPQTAHGDLGQSPAQNDAGDRQQRRFSAVLLCLSIGSLIAGGVLLVATDGVIAFTVGIALVGLAGITLVSLMFSLVGYSEERNRLTHRRG